MGIKTRCFEKGVFSLLLFAGFSVAQYLAVSQVIGLTLDGIERKALVTDVEQDTCGRQKRKYTCFNTRMDSSNLTLKKTFRIKLEKGKAYSVVYNPINNNIFTLGTLITHQADKGIELRYLKKSARHEKIDTTSRYMHAGDEQWHDAMQVHRLNKGIDTKDKPGS